MFPGGAGVCRSLYALCGLLCGSVAAFYGVDVLCIGLWNKIALWGRLRRSVRVYPFRAVLWLWYFMPMRAAVLRSVGVLPLWV